MKKRVAVCLVIAIMASGCQSIRPYDGVIGYQVDVQSSGDAKVVYVDEDNVGFDGIERKIKIVCAERLKTNEASLVVHAIETGSLERQVNITVPVPVGMSSGGNIRSGVSGGGGLMVGAPSNEAVIRNVQLKRMTAICSRKA